MTDEAMVLLYAKDRIVGTLGHIVKYWSQEVWNEYVLNILNQIEDSDIPRIRIMYED